MIQCIDGKKFRDMFVSGANNLQNNKDLVDIADKVLLSNDEKSDKVVLAKNNFGKEGLLYND